MAVMNFNLVNSITEKVYPISAPIGEGIDTTTPPGSDVYYDREGATYKNEGTEESPQWVIDKTLPYAFKHGYSVYFHYDESALNENYIEINDANELYNAQTGSNNNYGVNLLVMGAGGYLNLALWTETQYTPDPVTVLHSSGQGVGNTGWYRPNFGYPPGVAIGTDTNYGVMNSDFSKPLYLPDGKKPRISFNIETAKHGDYLYPIMVISGWYGYLDGDEIKYGIRWQRIVSTSLLFGAAEVVPGKTPSTTPNTTPAGGQGARNNYSYVTPMPSASGLSGLNYFSSFSSPGLHLYKIDNENWGKLLSIMWASDWMKKISQAVTSLIYGSTKAPADYVLSCTKIALPVTIDGEPANATAIYLGPVLYMTQDPDAYPKGKHLSTRYAETQTWTFDIYPYSDTYLDFDPYTKIEVHVPFCGTVKVSADACMRGQIEIKYIVDLVTGSCCAIIRCKDQFGNYKINSVLSGQCGISIPFAAQENTLDKIAGSIGSVVVGAASGSAVPMVSGMAAALTNASPYGGAKTSGTSTAGGAAAVLGDRSLYVAVYHPQDLTGLSADDPAYQVDLYGQKVGYPSAWFGTLQQLQTAALSGGQSHVYCECIIDPSPISEATDAEKEHIRQTLERGCYI